MTRSTSASQPPWPRAHLQPGARPGDPALPAASPDPAAGHILPLEPGLLAEAEAEVISGGGEELTKQQREQARRAAENLARRAKDLARLNDLALQNFAGPEYEILTAELAAYAYPVLLAWIRRAVIYKYCADRGRWVEPSDADRDCLASSFDERLQLALETTAEALTFFRRYVLLGGRWSYAGGASLTTYFIGSCLFTFPNVFRRWQGEHRRWRQAAAVEMRDCPEALGRMLTDRAGTDPAEIVTSRAVVMDALNAMAPGTRAAAALVLDDLSFADVGRKLGTTDRGIEGLLYRYRATRGKQERGRITGE
jgi:hypothetical protein